MQEGGTGGTFVIEQKKIDQLNKLADSLSLHGSAKFHGRDTTPFDISRPNLHDPKAEFSAEFSLVSAALGHVEALIDLFRARGAEINAEETAHLTRVIDAVNLAVRNGTRKKKIHEGRSRDLVVQNFRDTGFTANFAAVLIDMELGLRIRQAELTEQKELFWKTGHRSKSPYPYAIAYRFAHFYISQTGNPPKFGTSSHDGKPSTRFGNCLEEVFDILGIDAGIRGPAVSAAKEVVAEFFRNVPSGGMGLKEVDLLRFKTNLDRPSVSGDGQQ